MSKAKTPKASKKAPAKKSTKASKKAQKAQPPVMDAPRIKTYQVEYRVLFLTTVEGPNRRTALEAWSLRTGLKLGDDGRVVGHDKNTGSSTVPGDPGIEAFVHSKVRTELVNEDFLKRKSRR